MYGSCVWVNNKQRFDKVWERRLEWSGFLVTRLNASNFSDFRSFLVRQALSICSVISCSESIEYFSHSPSTFQFENIPVKLDETIVFGPYFLYIQTITYRICE